MISTKSPDIFDQIDNSSFDLYRDEDQADHIKSLIEYYLKYSMYPSCDEALGSKAKTNFVMAFAGSQGLCINEWQHIFAEYFEKLSLQDSVIRRNLMNYLLFSYSNLSETKERTLDNLDDDDLIVKYASDSCIDFCNSLGIIKLLRTVFQQILQTFSNVQHLCADVDFFDEDEDEDEIQRYVAISLEVTSSQEVVFEEYDQWTNWLIQELSPEEITYFTLTFRRR